MRWFHILGSFLFSVVLAIGFALGAHVAPAHSLLEVICGLFAVASAGIGIIVTVIMLVES